MRRAKWRLAAASALFLAVGAIGCGASSNDAASPTTVLTAPRLVSPADCTIYDTNSVAPTGRVEAPALSLGRPSQELRFIESW